MVNIAKKRSVLDPEITKQAIVDSFIKLNPIRVFSNPVIFVVGTVATLTTIFLFLV